MIKLLVLDMDGTLYNSKVELTERNYTAIMNAQKKGVRIALASGRSRFVLLDIINTLQLENYEGFIIGNNGQELYDFKQNTMTKKDKIKLSACKKLVQVAFKYNLEIFGHNDELRYSYEPKEGSKLHPGRGTCRFDEKKGYFTDELDMDKIGVFIAADRTDSYEILKELQDCIQDEAQCILVNANCIELVPVGMDKVNGIDIIVERYGLNKEEILVMGDGQNDLGMAKKYPFVAMANALDEVKKAAMRLTLSNDEDGVAFEIERSILN